MTNQAIEPTVPTTDYLIEMKIAPTGSVPTVPEGIAFTERYVLPTLQACEQLTASGRIIAGGPELGAMGFVFIVRVTAAREIEALMRELPIWPRAQTRVLPLTTFHERLSAVQQRLHVLQRALAERPAIEAAPSPARS